MAKDEEYIIMGKKEEEILNMLLNYLLSPMEDKEKKARILEEAKGQIKEFHPAMAEIQREIEKAIEKEKEESGNKENRPSKEKD